MKLALALVALILPASAHAAVAEVSISGSVFQPSATTIFQDDSVRWTNDDFLAHTVTFVGFGSPGALGNGETFEHEFGSAGTFAYRCTIHLGMNGSVKVLGPTAVAGAAPLRALTDTPVSFDGSGSSHNNPADGIVSYEWDFADTATGSGATLEHAYTAPGTYDVVLTVGDGRGATDTDNVVVQVGVTAISISNVRVREGNRGTRAAKFVVRLARASALTTTVDYGTVAGTARAPSDFRGKSGTVTFAPGEITKRIAVAVKGDTRRERNETFTVRLSNPGNAVVTDARGVGTIVDND